MISYIMMQLPQSVKYHPVGNNRNIIAYGLPKRKPIKNRKSSSQIRPKNLDASKLLHELNQTNTWLDSLGDDTMDDDYSDLVKDVAEYDKARTTKDAESNFKTSSKSSTDTYAWMGDAPGVLPRGVHLNADGMSLGVDRVFVKHNAPVIEALKMKGRSISFNNTKDDEGNEVEYDPDSTSVAAYLNTWDQADEGPSGTSTIMGLETTDMDDDDGFGVGDLGDFDDGPDSSEIGEGARARKGQPKKRSKASKKKVVDAGDVVVDDDDDDDDFDPSSTIWQKQLKAAGFDTKSQGPSDKLISKDDPAIVFERRVQVPIKSSATTSSPATRTQPSKDVATTHSEPDGSGCNDDDPKVLSRHQAVYSKLETTQQVRLLLELSYPKWAAQGFRLVHMTTGGTVLCPTPAEAAVALVTLERCVRDEKLNKVLRLSLCRDRWVLGLVESLRVTPPRLLPSQDTSISAKLWEEARKYWLPIAVDDEWRGDPTPGKKQQATGTSTKSRVSSPTPPAKGPQPPAPPSLRPPNGASSLATMPPSTKPLEQSNEGQPQSTNMVATKPVDSSRRELCRSRTFSAALRGLTRLGGATAFTAEVDALVAIARFSSWDLSAADLAHVVWCLAYANHWSARLADIESALNKTGGMAALRPRQVSMLLWGFAQLAYRPRVLLLSLDANWTAKAATKGQRTGLSAFNFNELCCCAWSLAVLRQCGSEPFRSLWREVCGRAARESARAGSTQLNQLWQVSMAIRLELKVTPIQLISDPLASRGKQATPQQQRLLSTGPATSPVSTGDTASTGKGDKKDKNDANISSSDKLTASTTTSGKSASPPGAESSLDAGDESAATTAWPQLATELLLRAESVFKAESAKLSNKLHSSLQRSVANTLTSMKVLHLLEDSSTGYSIDITIPSLRLALEVDGPTHFSRTAGPASAPLVMLGGTAMKRRHLQLQGWRVINVPTMEWERLTSDAARAKYLTQRMQAASKPPSTSRNLAKQPPPSNSSPPPPTA